MEFHELSFLSQNKFLNAVEQSDVASDSFWGDFIA